MTARLATAALAAAAALLAACGDDGPDSATREACDRWNTIAGSTISDSDAVDELNHIADLATNRNVANKAVALAIALEGGVTQTEVGVAYEEMDAACKALG